MRRLRNVATCHFRCRPYGIDRALLASQVLYRLHFRLPDPADNTNPTFTATRYFRITFFLCDISFLALVAPATPFMHRSEQPARAIS